MAPVHMLGTLSSKCSEVNGGLLFITVQLNGHEVLRVMDTSATDTFLSDRLVKPLGLLVKYCSNRVKEVNFKSGVVRGRTKWILI